MAKIHDPNMSILATEMWDNRIHRFFFENFGIKMDMYVLGIENMIDFQ